MPRFLEVWFAFVGFMSLVVLAIVCFINVITSWGWNVQFTISTIGLVVSLSTMGALAVWADDEWK